MNCLSQIIGCLSYALEQLGLYEPEISVQEARNRLSFEKKLWKKSQFDRNDLWNDFQSKNSTTGQLSPLAEKAIILLESHNIQKGIAVDLGCGINSTIFNLLERGWKVYAVDSSSSVIKTLTQKVSSMGKNWIEEGKLILVNQTIEEFNFPEKAHLIIANDSLPYCDPKKINKIFLDVKNALLPQGVFVGNLFPYFNPLADNMLRGTFWSMVDNKERCRSNSQIS